MPVSGNEEHGTIARQSSNSSAGVPIKKRRFPLVRQRSPPAEELSSTIPGENDSLQKEHTNSIEESSIPNACVAVNSPGLSDANKNIFPDEKKESPADTNVNSVQNNVKLSGVKLEELGLTICSGSMDKVDSNDKCQNNSKNTELQLKCNEPLALGVGEEMLSSRETEGVYGFEHANVPGNTELSLGPKERPILALAGQNNDGISRVPVKLDPSPLGLLLGNEKTITQPESNGVNSNHHNSHLPANRSNWDLNTAMDDWEGSVGDTPAGHGNICFSGLSESGGTHDMKIGVGVDSGKQVLDSSENRSIVVSSLNANRLCRSDDSLRLRLSTPYLQSNFIGEQSGVSAKEDSGGVVPSSNLLGMLVPSEKIDNVGRRTVKSEPPGHNPKFDFVGGKSTPLRLFDLRTVKHELVERPCLEAVNMSTFSTQKSVERRSVKSEPVQEVNQEIHNATEGTLSQSVGNIVQSQDNCSSTMAIPLAPKELCLSVLRSCSTELCISADISSQSEYTINTKDGYINTNVPPESFVNNDQVASETVCSSLACEGKTSNECDGITDVARVEGMTADDPERCRLKLMVEPSLNLHRNGERTVSDEEKINVSADVQEDDSYSTDADYESDGDHAVFAPMDVEDRQYGGEDDEYEDGEVRETIHTAVEGHFGERESVYVNVSDLDAKNVDSGGLLGDGGLTRFPADGNGTRVEDCSRTDDDQIKECVDTVFIEKSAQNLDRDGSMQESQTLELVVPEPDDKRLIKASLSRPLDCLGPNGDETEGSSDGATNGSQGTITTVGEACDGIIKGNDTGEKNDSTLPKIEASLNVNDAAKDANNGGNRSRIITLPRASNASDPCRTRSIPDRSFPSRIGRERYNDFEGDKLHPRGNRDEIYIGGPRKFLRERFQDRSLRNPRLNFMRGRGRGSSHSGGVRGGWNPDRDFTSEPYNDRADYRFPRHKRAPDNANADLECNGYMVTEDSDILGSGRGGRRKPLNDELPSFRHPSSRRRSPGSRDGPATRGIQMIRRLPRNISPGEDGSDVVGLRHDDKFNRGMPDDIRDTEYTRPQPPYERVDRQFVRGNRNFSSVQRRGLPRIRSKSPIRSRTRSPGPWSSPRRRSPDGFNGSPELTLRRSPAIYRIERMRSPDHPCFTGERVARRHGSPPFVPRPSNNMREMDSGRDHGHPRSVVQNRSSDRVLPRSTRRFDMVDSRERTDSDEYFVGPMQSGRFHEFGGDGSGDERRPKRPMQSVRSFRPPYNGAEDGNFRLHVEDGPRPFRFSREADPEFLERNNLRKREFDRRMKSQQLNAPRRTRSIDEQEGNYRNNGQVWNDDGFDDMSRGKRRRF